MTRTREHRSFLEQIADAEDPTPRDFDPEDQATHGASDDESHQGDGNGEEGAREHYVASEASQLRKSDAIDIGPQYIGSTISRGFLEQEDDFEDDILEPTGQDSQSGTSEVGSDKDGESASARDTAEDESLTSQRSARPKRRMEPEPEESSDAETSDMSSDISDVDEKAMSLNASLDSTTSSPPSEQNDRLALRKMMSEEQASVKATMSAAAKADISKGRAIKTQRATFDTLLNARIKLQKSLIAVNSMAATPPDVRAEQPALQTDAIRGAEVAALSLWNALTSLRSTLSNTSGSKTETLPKPSLTATSTTPSTDIWAHMQSQEGQTTPLRRATLSKWSQRTAPVSALRPQNKFSQVPAQQSLTNVLDGQLIGDGLERAVKRTRLARSCAPVQAKAAGRIAIEDPSIYDDADFYTLLLRELVDSRMTDTSSSRSQADPTILKSLPRQSDLKVKKQVDTKASKGRKMRYTVQEKLQNFMAADDRSSWGERQREELFGSLLGRKIDIQEQYAGSESGEGVRKLAAGADEEDEEEGLRLFG